MPKEGGALLPSWMRLPSSSGFRYLLSSGGTWAVDLVVFLALYRSMDIPVALFISRCAASAFGFTAHKFFSFQTRTKPSTREVVGYVVLASLNFIITALFLSAFASSNELLTAILKLSLEVVLFLINYLFLRELFLGRHN